MPRRPFAALAVIAALATASPVAAHAPAGSGRPSREAIDPEYRSGRRLVIAGAVTTIAAVAAYGAMAAGLGLGVRAEDELRALRAADDIAKRRDVMSAGRRANAMALASGLAAAALMGVGIALTVVGRRRQARSLSWFRPGGGGLGWRVRF